MKNCISKCFPAPITSILQVGRGIGQKFEELVQLFFKKNRSTSFLQVVIVDMNISTMLS